MHVKRVPLLAHHAVGTRHVAEGEPLVGGRPPGVRSHAGSHGCRASPRAQRRGEHEHERAHGDDRSSESPAHRWRLNDRLTYSSAVTSEGQTVVPKAQPVPAAPPSAGDVLRHGANVGFGALGLARRAVGTALARVQPPERRSPLAQPSTLDLVPGAIVGLALATERRVRIVVVGVASGTANTARVVTRPAVVQRALRPLEDLLWNWNEIARREQARNRAEASALLPMLVQQATENVIAQLDLPRIVSQIPIEDIVEQVDIEAIVAAHRPRRCHPRVDRRASRRKRSTRCASRGWRSTRSRRVSSTACSSASARVRSTFELA